MTTIRPSLSGLPLAIPARCGQPEDYRVKGLVLCPSSLYPDIASTLDIHMMTTQYPDRPFEDPLPNISHMAVEKALIIETVRSPQLLRAAMVIGWRS